MKTRGKFPVRSAADLEAHLLDGWTLEVLWDGPYRYRLLRQNEVQQVHSAALAGFTLSRDPRWTGHRLDPERRTLWEVAAWRTTA